MSPISRKRRTPGEPLIPSRYLLLGVTILCISLVVITYNTDYVSKAIGNAFGYLVVPFQDGISQIGTWMVDRHELMEDIASLQEQNTALKAENEELTTQNSALLQDRFELEELRELYQLDGQYTSYTKIGARIIAKDSGNWYHSFTINKGSNDGIETDMNVIAGGGLVGRVTLVGSNWARVETIIDDDSNVSASVLTTRDNLVVSGNLTLYADGSIEFARLTDTDDEVQVGDKIITSNISDKYLPGILIGYVSRIQKDPNNLTKSGLLTPAVDFAHLDTVLIIMQTKSVPEAAQ